MIFTAMPLPGAYVIDLEPHQDDRGFFARTWCAREFGAHGLETRVVQCSVSFNRARGTLRGLHYQVAPHAEAKLVRCVRGTVFDVVIDLRPDSAGYGRWGGTTLSAENRRMVYVPEGCAHGFQTLEDDTEVLYQMSEFHTHQAERGVRWDDPAFVITWPCAEPILSARDRSYPDFRL